MGRSSEPSEGSPELPGTLCSPASCRADLIGNDCSFDGVGGGGSVLSLEASPSGPSGSNPPSRDSNLVGCASTRRGTRGVRGPRAAGERGAVAADSAAVGGLGSDTSGIR